MEQRIFIVHGWGGKPNEAWLGWLAEELKNRNYLVLTPTLPNTDHPRIENWVSKLTEVVGIADEQTFFVGHSLGCQAIARYLITLPENIKIGGTVFVAGFFKRLTSSDLIEPDVWETAKHWLYSPLDLHKVRSHLKSSIAIFSDNDPDVPQDNQANFADTLGSEIIVAKNMGHFSPDDHINQLPIALESILKLLNS